MEINPFSIRYYEPVIREDIPKIDSMWQKRIRATINEKLTVDPVAFGIPLRHALKGHWKLRAGDYRIVFKITDETVFIIAIEHRSIVYKNILARIRSQG